MKGIGQPVTTVASHHIFLIQPSDLSALLLSCAGFPHVGLGKIKTDANIFIGILLAGACFLSEFPVLPWGFLPSCRQIFSIRPLPQSSCTLKQSLSVFY